MSPSQKARALHELYGYLHHDWVELEVVVQCANESVGFDDLQTVTPEARLFAASLIEDEGLRVGVLVSAPNATGYFEAWTGSKEEKKKRLLELMRVGEKPRGYQAVWFDRPEEEPIQAPQQQRP